MTATERPTTGPTALLIDLLVDRAPALGTADRAWAYMASTTPLMPDLLMTQALGILSEMLDEISPSDTKTLLEPENRNMTAGPLIFSSLPCLAQKMNDIRKLNPEDQKAEAWQILNEYREATAEWAFIALIFAGMIDDNELTEETTKTATELLVDLLGGLSTRATARDLIRDLAPRIVDTAEDEHELFWLMRLVVSSQMDYHAGEAYRTVNDL